MLSVLVSFLLSVETRVDCVKSGNIQPEGTSGTFNVETSSVEDGNLAVAGIFNIVVGSPEPVLVLLARLIHFQEEITHVLHVQVAGPRGYMHRHVGSDAGFVYVRAACCHRTLCKLQV